MENKEEIKTIEMPVFLGEIEMQKMVYIMFNQDIPRIEAKLDELIKYAKGEQDGIIQQK